MVSVLLDGELKGDEFAQACAVLETDINARQRWQDYQLIGEALRRGGNGGWVPDLAVRTHDEIFLSRLRAQITMENPPLELALGRMEHPSEQTPSDQWRRARMRGNDPYGAWRFTAGLCALVVVTMLGWQGVTGLQSASQARQLAQARPEAPSAIPSASGRRATVQQASARVYASPIDRVAFTSSAVGVEQPFLAPQALGQDAPMVMLRDPRLDRLMARQVGGMVRSSSDGRMTRPRLGRPGVAAQGVLVNLEKSPTLPR
ncbi:anti sigma-e protein rsea family protein [Hylemonella gracilis ATCC 19624]|uniref:Anti sigma-e protein rsea family protein n=1 Tax=Hylemonella gracilis ATCC 19624 TaxID=887062 RepID=F3KRX2_9BURK|nr:anti sigma-e protein rsea family protein [Hylemonella gracilis ATCC 19624]